MNAEDKKARACRLARTYRQLVNDGQFGRKVWQLWREGSQEDALLLDRCARVAALVAFYQSLDIPVEIIEKEIERL